MRLHRSTRHPRRPAACGLCRRPIDVTSGFWFDTEDRLGIVHPDCMSYSLERGDVPPGAILLHTCGEAACVRPDHLTLRDGEG